MSITKDLGKKSDLALYRGESLGLCYCRLFPTLVCNV